MATTTEDRPTETGEPARKRRWPSLREMYTIHREGPVTTRERRRSAIGAVVAVVVLAGAVGVFHLVDGSRRFDGSDVGVFAVVAVVVAGFGYAFPRFTTTPGLAMMSRHPDRNTTGGKVGVILLGLLLLVVGAAKVYY